MLLRVNLDDLLLLGRSGIRAWFAWRRSSWTSGCIPWPCCCGHSWGGWRTFGRFLSWRSHKLCRGGRTDRSTRTPPSPFGCRSQNTSQAPSGGNFCRYAYNHTNRKVHRRVFVKKDKYHHTMYQTSFNSSKKLFSLNCKFPPLDGDAIDQQNLCPAKPICHHISSRMMGWQSKLAMSGVLL